MDFLPFSWFCFGCSFGAFVMAVLMDRINTRRMREIQRAFDELRDILVMTGHLKREPTER
jgi:hypothetical protein